MTNQTTGNRIVLITGAVGGIGPLLVERSHANGDNVVATSLHKEKLDRWRTSFNEKMLLSIVAADISTDEEKLELLSKNTSAGC